MRVKQENTLCSQFFKLRTHYFGEFKTSRTFFAVFQAWNTLFWRIQNIENIFCCFSSLEPSFFGNSKHREHVLSFSSFEPIIFGNSKHREHVFSFSSFISLFPGALICFCLSSSGLSGNKVSFLPQFFEEIQIKVIKHLFLCS